MQGFTSRGVGRKLVSRRARRAVSATIAVLLVTLASPWFSKAASSNATLDALTQIDCAATETYGGDAGDLALGAYYAANGYKCAALLSKGQVQQGNFVRLGEVWQKRVGSVLQLRTIIFGTTNNGLSADAKLCLDDDTSPINDIVPGGADPSYCEGNDAATKVDHSTSGGPAYPPAVLASAQEEAAGKFELMVQNLVQLSDDPDGAGPIGTGGGFNVDIDGYTEALLHFNKGSDSIVSYFQPAAATTTTPVDEDPTIDVTKTANTSSVWEPGGTVTFTVGVTNTSTTETVTITSLNDNPYGAVTCPGGLPTLAPGATATCSVSGPVTGNAGTSHTDTVTAQGRDDDGDTASDTASATVTVADETPTIDVTKTAGTATVAEPGGMVTFTVGVTNTSTTETVTITSLNDNPYGAVTCPGGLPTLAPGATATCSVSGPVTGNAGTSHTDTVTAQGRDDDGDTASDTASATVRVTDVPPTVSVDKAALPTSVDEPGGSVTFKVKVTNTSNEGVTVSDLDDSVFGDVADASNPGITGTTCALGSPIPAGGTYECTFTADVIGPGGTDHTNTVTAEVEDDDNSTATDSDDATVHINDLLPTITVDKSASSSVVRTGQNVTYTYEVTTPGPESLAGVAVTDDKCSSVSFVGGDTDTGSDLDPGETWTYTCTTALTADTVNTATATGDDDEGNTATDTDTASVAVVDPRIAVDKSADPKSTNPGGRVTYTYLVTNPGTGVLSDVVLTDDRCSPVTFVDGDTDGDNNLDTGETWRYTCPVTVGNDVEPLTNVATVTAKDPTGGTVSATDTETIIVVLGQAFEQPTTQPSTGGTTQQPAPAATNAAVEQARLGGVALPATGSKAAYLLQLGLGLVVLGVLLMLPRRRRA